MLPTRLRNARRAMSTESLARSATETRIIRALVPYRACESVRATDTIAKGRERANMPIWSGLGQLSDEASSVKTVEPAPARIRIGQLRRQGTQVAIDGNKPGEAENVLCRNPTARRAAIWSSASSGSIEQTQ